jgi:hypothetical protein
MLGWLPWPWLAVVVVMMGWAGRAQASANPAARTSSLAWVRSDGADACIGGKELAEAVEKILGRRVFVSASAADVAVEGHVDRAADGWKATLRISGDHGAVLGDRELESQGPDCRAMDASLAFVIAVMIDPDAATRPAAPLGPPPQPPPPPVPPTPVPQAPSRWQIAPRLGVIAAFGELPAAAWGASAGLRLGPPALGVELLGAFFLPQDPMVSGPSGTTAHFTWAYAGAAVCPTLARLSAVSLAGCAGAAAGVLTVTPKAGLADEQGSEDFVVMATVRARLDWRMGPVLFVAADGGVDVPFDRPRWIATSADGTAIPVFRLSAVAGEAGLAFGLVLE